MTSTRPDSLLLPARFNGPPRSGNGGYAAGALAATLRPTDAPPGAWPAITVSLRLPPPLDTALVVQHGEPEDGSPGEGAGWAEARLDDALVLRAEVAADVTLVPVPPVPATQAGAAEAAYPGLQHHPFPTCFACGVDREVGDGLRIHPGPVEDVQVDGTARARVAATWTPDASLADEGRADDGRASVPATWAALDCIGAWSSGIEERPMVLARMTARVDRRPVVGEQHVVTGLAVGRDGRKNYTAASLYDAAGGLVATAEHLWIDVDPATF